MTEPYEFRGILRAGPEPGTVVLELIDTLKFYKIHLTGTKIEGGYDMRGPPEEMPEELKIPLLDDGGPETIRMVETCGRPINKTGE